MPASYHFEGRIFLITFYESTSDEQIRELYDTAFADPDFPTRCLSLVDVRKSTSLDKRSTESLKGLTTLLASHSDRLGKKVATVVSEPVQIGLMNMAAVFTEQHGMRMGVFKSLDEARAWLLHEDEEEQTSG